MSAWCRHRAGKHQCRAQRRTCAVLVQPLDTQAVNQGLGDGVCAEKQGSDWGFRVAGEELRAKGCLVGWCECRGLTDAVRLAQL